MLQRLPGSDRSESNLNIVKAAGEGVKRLANLESFDPFPAGIIAAPFRIWFRRCQPFRTIASLPDLWLFAGERRP
jgi:hypothetical protein